MPQIAITRVLSALAQCDALRPAVLMEAVALCTQTKPALRLVISPEDESRLRPAFVGAGLVCAATDVYLRATGGTWTAVVSEDTGVRSRLLTIAAAPSLANELLTAEMADPLAAGALLGYPDCCVHAFCAVAAQEGQWPFVLLATVPKASLIDRRCNRFAADWGGIGLMGELFPCSLQCQAAMRYADGLIQAVNEVGLKQLIAQATADSLQPIVVSAEGVITRWQNGQPDPVRFF